MPASSTPKTGTGSRFEYESFTVPGTWFELDNLTEFPELGSAHEAINNTPLSQQAHVYITGDEAEPDDISLVLKDAPGLAVHEDLVDRAIARGTANIRITYSTGRIAEVPLLFVSHKIMPPARGELCTIELMAKRNGAVALSKVV